MSSNVDWKCPYCNAKLRSLKGKYGWFWRCSNKDCHKNFFNDFGKPQLPEICPKCKCFIYKKRGKYGYFWQCENCKQIYDDDGGFPVLQIVLCPDCKSRMKLVKYNYKTKEELEKPYYKCTNLKCRCRLSADGKYTFYVKTYTNTYSKTSTK